MQLLAMGMRRLGQLALVAGLALSGCTRPQALPSTGPSSSQATPFEFHSGAWVNLHLILYGEALKHTGHVRGGGGGNGLVVLDDIDRASLPQDEGRAWAEALDLYARSYAERDPTFDDELRGINNKLSNAEAMADLSTSGIPDALAHVLVDAMPVYRAHWWAEDDARNRAFISALGADLDRYGPRLPAELAGLYQTEWPKQPIRVDVTRFATWGGAYTTLGPDHITISAADPRNQGPVGLESLLHEASHALIRPVRDALEQELAAQHKQADGLWHALLFFTAGSVVKERVPGYVPYGYKYRLYEGKWAAYRLPLEGHWEPFLEGRAKFGAAIHGVVAAL
jgi:hypothetical protein